ncbi:MAG: cell division protein SepF [Clostridia bacterium]|nr:cell division protein SepF [Clostridia bacterium]
MSIFKDIVKWTKGEDDEDDFEEFTPRTRRNQPAQEIEPVASSVPDHRKSDKVVNIHATTQLSVVLVKPERFENAAEIADHLRDRRTVVLNLEDTNKDIARRLIDFLSGVTYSLEGKIKKVANNTFIITPYTVDIMGDLIDELENNGLYI